MPISPTTNITLSQFWCKGVLIDFTKPIEDLIVELQNEILYLVSLEEIYPILPALTLVSGISELTWCGVHQTPSGNHEEKFGTNFPESSGYKAFLWRSIRRWQFLMAWFTFAFFVLFPIRFVKMVLTVLTLNSILIMCTILLVVGMGRKYVTSVFLWSLYGIIYPLLKVVLCREFWRVVLNTLHHLLFLVCRF